MPLPLVKIGNPILREKTSQVPKGLLRNRSFHIFLKKMVATMRQAQGVGLAANQVAKNIQVMVMECRGNKRYPRAASFQLQTYLNPRIRRYSKAKELGWEGCLSIPGFRGIVPRSKEISFEAITPDGRKISRVVRGFEARVIQHEVDHLNGSIYMDRMKSLKSWMHLEEFNNRFGVRVLDRKKSRGNK